MTDYNAIFDLTQELLENVTVKKKFELVDREAEYTLIRDEAKAVSEYILRHYKLLKR